MTRLVEVCRGRHVESWHSGAVVVVDSGGVIRAFAGDPGLRTFLRSAAKPFQALPLLSAGGVEEFNLSREEVALICASHGGELRHVATAAALLRKGDFDEDDLQCGAHAPFDRNAALELRQAGENPGPLHNNCSGKHAGMLLASQLLDFPAGDYLEHDHPLQQEIEGVIREFSGIPAIEVIPHAVDGCGVPTWFLSLYRAALGYARLSASAFGGHGGIVELQDGCRTVFEAMAGCPDLVAGSWSVTTPLIEAFAGSLIAKDGAEGFYAMGISPERSRRLRHFGSRLEDRGVGIAIKVEDGSMGRGRDPVILRVLDRLGCDETNLPPFESHRSRTIRNVAGSEVGDTRAAFELQFL